MSDQKTTFVVHLQAERATDQGEAARSLRAALKHLLRVWGWRRLRLVPFAVTIPPERQDKALPEKLAKEKEGILRWCLVGCQEWLSRGLAEPASVLAATDDYRGENDLLAQFMAECCVVAPHAAVEATALYRAFCEWCERNSERATKRKEFAKQLDDREFRGERLTSGSHKGRYVRFGIGLLAESEVSEAN